MGYYSLLQCDDVIAKGDAIEKFNRIAKTLQTVGEKIPEVDSRFGEKELLEKIKECSVDPDAYKDTAEFVRFYFKNEMFVWDTIYLFYRLDESGYIYIEDDYDNSFYQKHYADDVLAYLIAFTMDPGKVVIYFRGEDGVQWGYVIERKAQTEPGKVFELFFEAYYINDEGKVVKVNID